VHNAKYPDGGAYSKFTKPLASALPDETA